MLASIVESTISTILSYSADQDSYIKTTYIEDDIVESLPKNTIDTFETLINNLALEYLTEFASKAKENKELGRRLNSVHILNTFEFFLSNEARKAKIRKIFDEKRKLKFTHPFFQSTEEVSYAKIREKSINGFCYFLQKNHEDNNISPHLSSFVKKINKDHIYEKELQKLLVEGKYLNFFNKVLLED